MTDSVSEINPIIFFNMHLAWQHLMELYFFFAFTVPITSAVSDQFAHWINFGFVGIPAVIYWWYHRKLVFIRYKLRKIKPNMNRSLTMAEQSLVRQYLVEFQNLRYAPQMNLLLMVCGMINAGGADFIDAHQAVTMNAQTIVISYIGLVFISMDIPYALQTFFPLSFCIPTIVAVSFFLKQVYTPYRLASLLAVVLSSIWITFVMSLDKKDSLFLTCRYDPTITPVFIEAQPSLAYMFSLKTPHSSSPSQIGEFSIDDDPSYSETTDLDSNVEIKRISPFASLKNEISYNVAKIWAKIHPVGEHFTLWLDSVNHPQDHFFNQILARMYVAGRLVAIGQIFLFIAFGLIIFSETDESGLGPAFNFSDRRIPFFISLCVRLCGVIWALTGLYMILNHGNPSNIVLTSRNDKILRLGPAFSTYVIVNFLLLIIPSIGESLVVAGHYSATYVITFFRIGMCLYFVFPISTKTARSLQIFNTLAVVVSAYLWNIPLTNRIVHILGGSLSFVALHFMRLRFFGTIFPLRLREIQTYLKESN